MPNQANVNSFDAIQSLRAAMLVFAKQSDEGLTECETEMRRLLEWLEHDRPGFWKEQVRLAHDAAHKAKGDLHRCLMYPVGVNDRPACTEERAALKKAEAYLAHCREKQERLRHWIREVRHELHTYQGRTTRLREVVEHDTPKAAAVLAKMLTTLEEYQRLNSPTAKRSASVGGAGTNGGNADESPSSQPPTDAAAETPTDDQQP
ncbi:MAG: hypothetical protein AAGJ46_17820 [Planctomycetota bacterium]